MSKYFEIVYSPEQFNAQTNSAQVIPWGGVHTKAPANVIPPNYFTQLDDCILHNATITSRPSIALIVGPDTNRLLGTAPGIPGSKNSIRIAFTTAGVYWQDVGLVWHILGNNPNFNSGAATAPVSWRVFQGIIYFSNGNAHLSSWDGSSNNIVVDNATVAGPTTVGAKYLDEVDNHLILANTNEGGTLFPQRVRWSANGLPAVWDPTINVNAGFADFLEVSDNITGMAMTGRVGQILRTNGITEMAPTGNGIAPFDFNHLWAARQGIGSPLGYSLAVYGSLWAFVASDEIYVMTNQSMSRIGGPSLDAIMADLAAIPASSAPGLVVGMITPILGVSNFSFPYLSYLLLMPSGDGLSTILWLYNFDDHNWVRWNFPGQIIYGTPSINDSHLFAAPSGFPGELEIPFTPSAGGTNQIATINLQSGASFYNDAAVGSSLTFRVEDVEPNRVPTVRRVILDYLDYGVATITVRISASNDNGIVNTVSVPVIIGSVAAGGAIKTKFVDLTITGFRPQLAISRAANAGPMALVRVVMVGESEQVQF